MPFLAEHIKVDRLKPMGQPDVAVLEDRSDLDRELLAALVALTQPRPRGLAGQLADAALIAVPAVRANRTRRPQIRLNVVVGGLFVFEVLGR